MAGNDILTRMPGDVLSAFSLLTRLPMPDHTPRGAASAWAWPLVGATLGALAAFSASVAQAFGLTPGLVAALVMGLLAALTGALHEDGLADTADGLFGGWTKERRLEIMKDSRIGTYGALALMLITIARWSALSALLTAGAGWPALIAAGAFSRVPMAVMMATLPNARAEGLSHRVGRPTLATAALAVALGLGVAVLAVGGATLPMLMVTFIATFGLGLVARARIGGQSGDILGASQQLAELSVLAVLASGLN